MYTCVVNEWMCNTMQFDKRKVSCVEAEHERMGCHCVKSRKSKTYNNTNTVEPPNKGHFGLIVLSLIERLSLSLR